MPTQKAITAPCSDREPHYVTAEPTPNRDIIRASYSIVFGKITSLCLAKKKSISSRRCYFNTAATSHFCSASERCRAEKLLSYLLSLTAFERLSKRSNRPKQGCAVGEWLLTISPMS